MVNLAHESILLQKIEDFYTRGKIQGTVGLTVEQATLKIKQLIPTTSQRLNAVKFYLDSMENVDYVSCIRNRFSGIAEQKQSFVFSNSDFKGEINLLTPDALHSIVFLTFKDGKQQYIQSLKMNQHTLPLIVFLVVSGFLSHLVSSEDCLSKIINIVYDLISYNKRYHGSDLRIKLKNKIPHGELTRHLCSFFALPQKIGQDIENKIGSPFNISKQIRNRLTHDDITDIINFPSAISLSGFVDDSDLNLFFDKVFFPDNTMLDDTEIIAFCRSIFKETVKFIDDCYRLIHDKLRSSGKLPV